MFNCRNWGLVAALLLIAGASSVAGAADGQVDQRFEGIGRPATPSELAAWNIDVRPDFQGLPPGSGSVAQGQDIWEGRCSQCHGIFGDSGEVFTPLVGGVTADDVKTGRVAKLKDPTVARTTFMKAATLSSIFDYINRAMPWNAPKSLKPDEVYAVLAYLLNLSSVLPDDFVLSDHNIGAVQARMPNRNGMTTQHSMWPGPEFGGTAKPDVANVACMHDCPTESRVASFLPEFARNAHGNLAAQNRTIGAELGANTDTPEASSLAANLLQARTAARAAVTDRGAASASAVALIAKNGCTVCHGVDKAIVGPAYVDVAHKYAGNSDYLAGRIRAGSSGVWGVVPMPAQTLPDADLKAIAEWLAAGAAH